jgi:microcystin degradation protein MlrC
MIKTMRIAIIHIGQETNDFNPVPTTLRDYESFGIVEGPAILDTYRGVGEIGGFVDEVRNSGRPVEFVPIVRGWAVAGGRITQEAYRFFEQKIRQGLEAAGPIDGLSLQLHGACAAEGIDDVEGEQIALCRQILGPPWQHHAQDGRAGLRHRGPPHPAA